MAGWYQGAKETITSERAKEIVDRLIGDGEARAPHPSDPRKPGKPYFHFFCSLSEEEAREEARQVAQLPEGDRERDLMERMGLF